MKIVKLYALGGFRVRVILMDMEFEKVKDEVELVELNTTAAREHVGEIERSIRQRKVQMCLHQPPLRLLPQAAGDTHGIFCHPHAQCGTQQAGSV